MLGCVFVDERLARIVRYLCVGQLLQRASRVDL